MRAGVKSYMERELHLRPNEEQGHHATEESLVLLKFVKDSLTEREH